jgi:hypothetical protein
VTDQPPPISHDDDVKSLEFDFSAFSKAPVVEQPLAQIAAVPVDLNQAGNWPWCDNSSIVQANDLGHKLPALLVGRLQRQRDARSSARQTRGHA